MTKDAGFSLTAVNPSPLSSQAEALAEGALAGGVEVSRGNAEACSTLTVVPGLADKLPIWGAEESRSVGIVDASVTNGNWARNSGVRGVIPGRFMGGSDESGGKPKKIFKKKNWLYDFLPQAQWYTLGMTTVPKNKPTKTDKITTQ